MRDGRRDIKEEVVGKWRGLLGTFGLDDCFLRDKHGPCPLCGDGVDRYRWDNKEGRGTYYCSTCGYGDGWDLLMRYKGWDFFTAAKEVRAVLGIVEYEAPKPETSTQDTRQRMQAIWKDGHRVVKDDVVDRYLTSRGVALDAYPPTLKLVERCWYAKEGEVNVFHPAMVGVIQSPEGIGVNLHRTYLTPEGRKVDGEAKKVLKAPIPPGSAIRLFKPGFRLGVAEGIETALACMKKFGVPVWALVNAGNLAAFEPPPEVEELLVFGDNDKGYAGQEAAYRLAKRFSARRGKTAEVHIPGTSGYDWLDQLQQEGQEPCLTKPSSLSSTPSGRSPSSLTGSTAEPSVGMLH
jgi:putative DNA primase/helicase